MLAHSLTSIPVTDGFGDPKGFAKQAAIRCYTIQDIVQLLGAQEGSHVAGAWGARAGEVQGGTGVIRGKDCTGGTLCSSCEFCEAEGQGIRQGAEDRWWKQHFLP